MCRTMAQTLPFTHTYMSVCKQEGKHERMYTRFLTLINFWREHGNGEMGEGERRDSQARIRLYSENMTCASMQNWMSQYEEVNLFFFLFIHLERSSSLHRRGCTYSCAS